MVTQYRFPEITDQEAAAMLSLDEFGRWRTAQLCIVRVSKRREVLAAHTSTIEQNEHTPAVDCYTPITKPLTAEQMGSLRQWIWDHITLNGASR